MSAYNIHCGSLKLWCLKKWIKIGMLKQPAATISIFSSFIMYTIIVIVVFYFCFSIVQLPFFLWKKVFFCLLKRNDEKSFQTKPNCANTPNNSNNSYNVVEMNTIKKKRRKSIWIKTNAEALKKKMENFENNNNKNKTAEHKLKTQRVKETK